MTAHLIIVLIIFWSRDGNIKACLPATASGQPSPDQYAQKDTELIVGLSVTLGLFIIEFAGFFGGISMFMPTQSLLSISAHLSAAVTLSYFVFETWSCDMFWYVFGFCSCMPAIFEIFLMIGVLAFKKGM